MLKQRYLITTDVARVYKARARSPRCGWGWATATIREWPRGGQIDVQSDFGTYAHAWGAIGHRTLREFLCDLDFDYFMGKAARRYRCIDADATLRAIKGDIFCRVKRGLLDRGSAHEWRDDLDELEPSEDEHVFAERLMALEWLYQMYDGGPPFVSRDDPQARAFWDGPWQALCEHWRAETAPAQRVAA